MQAEVQWTGPVWGLILSPGVMFTHAAMHFRPRSRRARGTALAPPLVDFCLAAHSSMLGPRTSIAYATELPTEGF